MNILIVGAGMAGLVAANMLRRHTVTVWEKGTELPRNHTAVLRFRSPAVSDATGIPFTRETVYKGLWRDGSVWNEATLEDMNRYSLLVTGGNLYGRSLNTLGPSERWCAPQDFIEQMARNVTIKYNLGFAKDTDGYNSPPIISTAPMPAMMIMYGWRDKPEFRWLPVWTIRCRFRSPLSRVCQTLYQTDPFSWYRATIHGQEMTLEFMFDPLQDGCDLALIVIQSAAAFGLHPDYCTFHLDARPEVNKIPIGKIQPIDETVRKRFMLWLTEKHGVYSLGRFATWRNILLDDVVKDVKRIEEMIEKQTTYDHR